MKSKKQKAESRNGKGRTLAGLISVFCFLNFNFPSAHAETLLQLRNRVDTWLTNRWPTVVARQTTYAANHAGKFWQGLITHSTIPTHLTATPGDVIANRLTFTPTDQLISWHDVFPEWDSEVFAAAASCDVYDGPLGKGYVVTVWVRFNGVTYMRAKGVGPEDWHDLPWTVLVVE